MTMKVVKLTATNVKRLKAVEITPEGHIVEIAGANGQGKTSVLDAMVWAIMGKRAIQREPIRQGEDGAEVLLDLGDIRVQRTWKRGHDTKLKIFSANGVEQTSPQRVLDRLVGEISFDPLEFSRMDKKKQRDTLLKIAGLDESLLEIEAKRAAIYEKRRDIGKEKTRLVAEVEGIPATEKEVPTEEVSIANLTGELNKALEQNAASISKKQRLEEMEKEIEVMETAIQVKKEKCQESAMWLLAFPDMPSIVATLKNRLETAEETNRLVRQENRRLELGMKAKEAIAQYDGMTGEIEQLDRQKKLALRAATFPIPGLSVDFEGATFNDVPFEQAADSEKCRVSMAVAMALNPMLRVIRMADGSLLDRANMKLIGEMAKDGDYQVWIERVEASSPAAVIIEDGMVKSQEKEETDD